MSVTDIPYVQQLFATGEGAPTIEQKIEILTSMRARRASLNGHIDRLLLSRCEQLSVGLEEARTNQAKLREVLDELGAPPWHLGCFLGTRSTPQGERALVSCGGSRLVVAVSPETSLDALVVGDDVLLSQERNCILAKLPTCTTRDGETATFSRRTPDGRLIVESDGKELVVRAAAVLDVETLLKGDRLLCDKRDGVAFEKIERSKDRGLFCEQITPRSQGFEAIGGLDRQIRELQNTVGIRMNHPEIAEKYELVQTGGVLLTGTPGVGKTLLARGLAAYLARTGGSGSARYVYIRPGEFKTMWYGETERKIRETFGDIIEASLEDPRTPVVLHLAEVDAIGAARGQSFSRIDDRVSQALMEELDGVTGRGNVMVIADTNRADALDPAMLRPGRLGDLVIEVPRPNRTASRQIFEKHLSTRIPCVQPREEIIASCVSTVFSTNGDGELVRVTFRDGRRHTVRAADLISGAVIANICRKAVKQAAVREIRTGQTGLTLDDFLTAMREEFETIARVLTPINIRHHLGSLPQDADVVAVTPVERKVPRPHRYLNLSVA